MGKKDLQSIFDRIHAKSAEIFKEKIGSLWYPTLITFLDDLRAEYDFERKSYVVEEKERK